MEELIIGLVTGFVLGALWHLRRVTRSIISDPQRWRRLIRDIEKVQEPPSTEPQGDVMFKIERVNDLVYLWQVPQEEFLAQGRDLNEALTRARERYPHVNLVRSEDSLSSEQFSQSS